MVASHYDAASLYVVASHYGFASLYAATSRYVTASLYVATSLYVAASLYVVASHYDAASPYVPANIYVTASHYVAASHYGFASLYATTSRYVTASSQIFDFDLVFDAYRSSEHKCFVSHQLIGFINRVGAAKFAEQPIRPIGMIRINQGVKQRLIRAAVGVILRHPVVTIFAGVFCFKGL